MIHTATSGEILLSFCGKAESNLYDEMWGFTDLQIIGHPPTPNPVLYLCFYVSLYYIYVYVVYVVCVVCVVPCPSACV